MPFSILLKRWNGYALKSEGTTEPNLFYIQEQKMAYLNAGTIQSRIMLDPASTIKFMEIHSSPYRQTRWAIIGLEDSNFFGTEFAEYIRSSPHAPLTPRYHLDGTGRKMFEELKAQYPDSTLSVEAVEGKSGLVSTAIKIEGLGQLRKLVKHLAETGRIKENDVAKLIPQTREVEAQLVLEKELVPRVTAHQSAIIAQEFEKDIETVIAAIEKTTLKLPHEEMTKRDLALAFFVDCMQSDSELPTLVKYDPKPASSTEFLNDSANRLRNFYRGTSGLEKKLTENSFTCPTLEKQRAILFKFINERLDQVFGCEFIYHPRITNPDRFIELREKLFSNDKKLEMLKYGTYTQVVLIGFL